MIIAIDVFYKSDCQAKAVAILFDDWYSQNIKRVYSLDLEHISEYKSGEFYKRELPCIVQLLELIEEEYDYIIIDGYVYLGEEKKAGLGRHLWNALSIKRPIIGVAKNYFKGTSEDCFVLRGSSEKPLYITAIGIPHHDAVRYISEMYGEHRMPYMLKAVDLLSRK